MKRKTLPNRHPDSMVVRAKVWTHARSTIEVEGPYDDEAAVLVLACLSIVDPTPEQLEVMREAVEALGFRTALDAERARVLKDGGR